MPNFEQPQQSNTPPDVDELLEKARAKEQARKSVDVGAEKANPEASEAVSAEAPASMEELLAGLKKETEEVKETPQATAEQGMSQPITHEDPVRTELEEKNTEFIKRYHDGHAKFGDKWTSTPEFMALGGENSRFHAELKAKGFTMENGIVKPIDKEKLERERQTNEVNEQMSLLVNNSNVDAGKLAYAVLTDNESGFKEASIQRLNAELKLNELSLKRAELEFAGMSEEDFKKSRNTSSTKEYLLKQVSESQQSEAKRTKEYIADFDKFKDRIKDRKGDLASGKGVGAGKWSSELAKGQRVENPTDLVRGLKKEFEKLFDDLKGYQGRFESAIHTARELKGVAFAALEAGDVKTAAEALAFTENLDPMSPEQMQEMVSAISKLKPEQKREFVTTMDAEKKQPHREYKIEAETRSEKPIYSTK